MKTVPNTSGSRSKIHLTLVNDAGSFTDLKAHPGDPIATVVCLECAVGN